MIGLESWTECPRLARKEKEPLALSAIWIDPTDCMNIVFMILTVS